MQLTTKIEYTVRALTELAKVTDGKPVTIKEICSRQQLPAKYMEQLFRKLKRKQLINSTKGALGGYILNASPDRLSLREIMSAVEDEPVRLDCCGDKGNREFCIGSPCDFYTTWQDIKKDLDQYFGNIPLSRFINH